MSYRLEKHMSCQMMVAALFFLILQTNLLFFSVESFCYNNGNYTLNSTYSNNLDTALSSIPANIGISGFYNASAGSRNPDIAYAIALCRGDVQPPTCRECIREITTALRTSCPNQKQAIDWSESEFCMLRYSDENMLGILATEPARFWWIEKNASSPMEFMRDLRRLLEDLRGQAAGGGSVSSCLTEAAADLPSCCDRRIRARVSRPSCYLQYETHPFYNETRIQELVFVPPPLPPFAPGTPSLSPMPPFATRTPSLSTPPPGPTSGNKTIIIVVVSVAVCVILSVFVFIRLRKRIKTLKRRPEENHETDEIITVESLKYTLSTIRDATNDFFDDNKLGQGGFGAVYKGILPNGHEIAVKRLSQNSGQGDLEFKNEVLLLAKLQHRNLVKLLGFCVEGVEKLLIYEFVQNASLDQFIFDPIKRSYLDWEKRYKIIGGIARGILYLHEDSRIRIIHRDLKPSNVLLDGEMNPKIADFGMARLFGQDDTRGITNRIAGTYGYMAPEYAAHGQFSIKSDVFSFGVLVLEIISGQKNNNVQRGENVEDLLSFAWKNWNARTPAEIVDPILRSGSGFISYMERCIHIGLLCVQENAADRPTMASVVLMLNSFSITLGIPSEPAFYMPSDYGSDTSALLQDKNSSNSNVQTHSGTSSRNEASVSDLYPR
ncbi:cysteine-rich receptor-like protein kinase 26 [Phtheirospermum japonicum]|uniref:Cysteine-rich receptor-like protein kinase 26 n=1 Tax=Phtheirospermum japonicum TaxID=374723 RepID=A0A830CFE3_9LAMI|nr:cysteine-rich receptor-like protein kinase 26 [Phtheirospermum japonicum]